MSPAWLILVAPIAFSLGVMLGAVLASWNRPDDAEPALRQPDDPFRRWGE